MGRRRNRCNTSRQGSSRLAQASPSFNELRAILSNRFVAELLEPRILYNGQGFSEVQGAWTALDRHHRAASLRVSLVKPIAANNPLPGSNFISETADSTVSHVTLRTTQRSGTNKNSARSRTSTNYTTAFGYTATQIRQGYGLGSLSNSNFTNRGAGQTVAVVLWYDTPTILADLTQYSLDMGLPAPTSTSLKVVYAAGTKPVTADQNTMIELDGDVETIHAIAPLANIIVVEASSPSSGPLYSAIDKAVSLLKADPTGGGVVNMSFGLSESQSVASLESHFTSAGPTISFVAATGDSASELSYPSTSPEVTAAGGTTLSLNSSGNRLSETAWSSGGGGVSTVFSSPAYQSALTINGSPTGSMRVNPDVALSSDPGTGSAPTGDALYHSWTDQAGNTGYDFDFGGTSQATPLLTGMITLANEQRTSAGKSLIGSGLNSAIYGIAAASEATNFNDITTGSNGNPTYTGFDLATGWGSPQATNLISALAASGPTIGNFTATSSQATQLALTASGVSDVNSTATISSVAFYRENGKAAGFQPFGSANADTLIGSATLGNGDVWSITVDTSSLPLGNYTYYAVATDSLGATSLTATTSAAQVPEPLILSGQNEYLRYDPDGVNLDVWTDASTPGAGTPTQKILLNTLNGVTVNGSSGGDVLTLDYSNGNFSGAFANGITDNAAGGETNAIDFVGTAGNDILTATSSGVTFGSSQAGFASSTTVALSNVQTIQLTGGSGGSDLIHVASGAYTLMGTTANGTPNVSLTVDDGAIASLADTESLADVNLRGTLDIVPSGINSISMNTLTIGGNGVLDLADNSLKISNTPEGTIRQYLINGYNLGTWDGVDGIVSSTAANNLSGFTVGYASAVDNPVTGLALTGNQVEVKTTLPGDATLDGTVDINDLNVVLNNYLTDQSPSWATGDLNFDGSTDIADLNAVLNNYLS